MGQAVRPDRDVGDDIDAWAEHALDVLTSLSGVRRAGIAVVEGGGRRLSFTSAEQTGAGIAPWCHVDAYDDVPLNTAVRTGRAVVGNLHELTGLHRAFVERQRDTGSQALAAVPLVGGGRTRGGFVLFYRERRSFGDRAVDELAALGVRLGEDLHSAQGRRAQQPGGWVPDAPPPGAEVVEFSVANDPAAIGLARHELRDAMLGWDMDPDTIDRAMLCLSELVTNAVVHAASASWVHATNHAGTVSVTVHSPGSRLHARDRDAADPLPVHGRGLQLVEALSSHWGSNLQEGGLTTWFALER